MTVGVPGRPATGWKKKRAEPCNSAPLKTADHFAHGESVTVGQISPFQSLIDKKLGVPDCPVASLLFCFFYKRSEFHTDRKHSLLPFNVLGLIDERMILLIQVPIFLLL